MPEEVDVCSSPSSSLRCISSRTRCTNFSFSSRFFLSATICSLNARQMLKFYSVQLVRQRVQQQEIRQVMKTQSSSPHVEVMDGRYYPIHNIQSLIVSLSIYIISTRNTGGAIQLKAALKGKMVGDGGCIHLGQSKSIIFDTPLLFLFECLQPRLQIVPSECLEGIGRPQQINQAPEKLLLPLEIPVPPSSEDGVAKCEGGVGVGDVRSDDGVDGALEEEAEVVGDDQDDGDVEAHHAVPEDGLRVLVRSHPQSQSALQYPVLLARTHPCRTSQTGICCLFAQFVKAVVVVQSQEGREQVFCTEVGTSEESLLEGRHLICWQFVGIEDIEGGEAGLVSVELGTDQQLIETFLRFSQQLVVTALRDLPVLV